MGMSVVGLLCSELAGVCVTVYKFSPVPDKFWRLYLGWGHELSRGGVWGMLSHSPGLRSPWDWPSWDCLYRHPNAPTRKTPERDFQKGPSPAYAFATPYLSLALRYNPCHGSRAARTQGGAGAGAGAAREHTGRWTVRR